MGFLFPAFLFDFLLFFLYFGIRDYGGFDCFRGRHVCRLVPTPNGAGPWHFAVKTILVLYGVCESDAVVFVLIVHTLQTLLVILLGLYAAGALAFTRRRCLAGGEDGTE